MRYTGVLESCTHTHTHTHTHTRKHTWRQFMFLARIKAGPAALLESRHVMMVVMVKITWDKVRTAEQSASHLEDATNPVGALSGSAT